MTSTGKMRFDCYSNNKSIEDCVVELLRLMPKGLQDNMNAVQKA